MAYVNINDLEVLDGLGGVVTGVRAVRKSGGPRTVNVVATIRFEGSDGPITTMMTLTTDHPEGFPVKDGALSVNAYGNTVPISVAMPRGTRVRS